MSCVRTAGQRGIGLFEVVMALVIGATALTAALTVVASADRLSTGARIRMRATAKYREAHAVVGQRLQAAAIDTLAGFDTVTGDATVPSFKPVTGMAAGVVTLGPQTELKFVLQAPSVAGVGEVGHVVVEPAGGPQEIIATGVVKDSFRVRQEGLSLVVRLKTYYISGNQDPVILEGTTVVSLRN